MPILQVMLDVTALGAAYALVALGFVLLLNATGAVNFAQGDLVMLGGVAGVALAGFLPWPAIAVLPSLLALMAMFGLALAAIAYMPLRRRAPEAVFISTIAVGIMLENGTRLVFGSRPRATPALLGEGRVNLGPIVADTQALAIVVVTCLLIAGLHLLFTRTLLGRRLRATAQDREMAALLGIRVDRMIAATFAVAAALAGAAGLLLANRFFVTPSDGAGYILKAYVATAIGGWGSLPGAVLGALLIAAFEVLYPSLPLLVPRLGASGALFSQTAAAILLDGAILVILMVRPSGLFGDRFQRRA